MSVDFPAPFSPSKAWISPRCRSRSTPSSAVTPGKRLVTPWSRNASVPVKAGRFIHTSHFEQGCRSAKQIGGAAHRHGAAERYFAGAASAGMMLLSIQIGLFTSDLNIAALGAQLYCGTVSPFSLRTANERPI